MRIKYLGHSSFLITEESGIRLITDPYKSEAYGGLKYKPITEVADIVLISHEHDDHNYYKDIKGEAKVVRGEGEKEVLGIKIEGITTYHDGVFGRERGKNTVFVIEMEGMRIAHLGDLGELLSKEVEKKIGEIHLLFLPVGGYFTIDAEQATEIMNDLKPLITIPMHYKTTACEFPISPVDEFLSQKPNCRLWNKSEVEVKKEDLPQKPEIWVLKPSQM